MLLLVVKACNSITGCSKRTMLSVSTALRIKPVHFSLANKLIPKSLPTSSSPSEYRPWSGLQLWRQSPINEGRLWGPTGPEPPPENDITSATASFTDDDGLHAAVVSASSLAEMGSLVLSTADPLTKSKLSHLAYSRWRHQNLPVGVFDPPARPARSPKPQVVFDEIPCHELKVLLKLLGFYNRNAGSKGIGLPLNAYMLHNLAHVELNAIDLAWDTVVRFSPHYEILGKGFFEDFAHVADDESRHLVGALRDWLSLASAMVICLLIIFFGESVRNHLTTLLLVWLRSLWFRRPVGLMPAQAC